MGKLTWQQLGQILEGQFNTTPDEAAETIFATLLNKDWKGSATKVGKMWQDQSTVEAWTRVLYVYDELAAKHGKSKAMLNFYNKHTTYFEWCATSKTSYKTLKTFRNYFTTFNKLPTFNATGIQGYGTKLVAKAREKEIKGLLKAQKHNLLLAKRNKNNSK